eukprot:jgi/Ulvmu1/5593/UM023_0130.1
MDAQRLETPEKHAVLKNSNNDNKKYSRPWREPPLVPNRAYSVSAPIPVVRHSQAATRRFKVAKEFAAGERCEAQKQAQRLREEPRADWRTGGLAFVDDGDSSIGSWQEPVPTAQPRRGSAEPGLIKRKHSATVHHGAAQLRSDARCACDILAALRGDQHMFSWTCTTDLCQMCAVMPGPDRRMGSTSVMSIEQPKSVAKKAKPRQQVAVHAAGLTAAHSPCAAVRTKPARRKAKTAQKSRPSGSTAAGQHAAHPQGGVTANTLRQVKVTKQASKGRTPHRAAPGNASKSHHDYPSTVVQPAQCSNACVQTDASVLANPKRPDPTRRAEPATFSSPGKAVQADLATRAALHKALQMALHSKRGSTAASSDLSHSSGTSLSPRATVLQVSAPLLPTSATETCHLSVGTGSLAGGRAQMPFDVPPETSARGPSMLGVERCRSATLTGLTASLSSELHSGYGVPAVHTLHPGNVTSVLRDRLDSRSARFQHAAQVQQTPYASARQKRWCPSSSYRSGMAPWCASLHAHSFGSLCTQITIIHLGERQMVCVSTFMQDQVMHHIGVHLDIDMIETFMCMRFSWNIRSCGSAYDLCNCL